jgi:hypothetical protein
MRRARRSLALLAASLLSHGVLAADIAAHSTGGRSPSGPEGASAPSSAPAIAPLVIAPQPALARPARHANFGTESASGDARHVADWIVDSGDNQRLPFLIVDKKNARVFAFAPTGEVRGAAAALLGMAPGDDSSPGIGQRNLSAIRPDERTTPAGRFVANLDRDLHGQEILWIDYDTAIALHRVVTRNPKERRAERLASPATEDKRISWGCINVPATFYDKFVSPAFKKTNGIVYILPDTRSVRETFGSYDVDEHAREAYATAAALVTAKGGLHGERTIRLR